METFKDAQFKSYILLQSLIYGIGNPLTKIAYESITPFWLLSFRFSMAFLIFMIFFGKRILLQLKSIKSSVYLPASLCMASAYISCNLALNWTSATNVGFIMSLPVILTPILSKLILKQKYDFRYLPFQCIVIIGLYLLCSGPEGFVLNKGDILALVTALSASGALVFGKKSLESLDAVTISATQSGITAIMSLLCAFSFDDFNILPQIAYTAWGVIIYLALTCTFLAYILQNSALLHLSSSTISMLQCTQPILTAVFSFLILGEMMSIRGILGGIIIIGSILLANQIEARSKQILSRPI